MEEIIGIAKLLKKCPKGFELYSPMYGVGELVEVDCTDDTAPIIVEFDDIWVDKPIGFMDDGRLCPDGEVMLFPSKDMRDWSMFHIYKIKQTIMEEMKMFFEQIRQEEKKRSVMQEIDAIVDDFNQAIDEILEKLKQ